MVPPPSRSSSASAAALEGTGKSAQTSLRKSAPIVAQCRDARGAKETVGTIIASPITRPRTGRQAPRQTIGSIIALSPVHEPINQRSVKQ